MPLTSILLEYSGDPLSDASPGWTTVPNTEVMRLEWWAGIDREGDEPKPGGATIVLKNVGRKWEPDFGSNTITTGRRFRLTLNDGGGATQEGLWYVSDIAIDYPAGTGYSEVTMTCSDGCEVLALDALPLMDPPDADTYADVVQFDEPWGYWRLGDPEGTSARVNIVTRHWRVRGRRLTGRYRIGQRVTTRSPAEGVSGPAGVYVNTPTLGEPGAILGDADTAVFFAAADDERVTVTVDADVFKGARSITLEGWINLASVEDRVIVSGPFSSGASSSIFKLQVSSTALPSLSILRPGSFFTLQSSAISTGAWHHIVGVWASGNAWLYVDGALAAESASAPASLQAQDGTTLWVGADENLDDSADATIDEPAIYERALSADRVLAHYTAGTARGWPQQTAGERIADIATHALWSEASIQTAGRDVQPQFKHGQAKLDEISELAHAEGPRTMFFFNGNGDPVYLGHEWQATSASYNTVQATLGDSSGEVGYETIELVYDNETYSEVTASHESGEAATAADATSESERGRRTNTEYTDVLLMEHTHVESLANAVLAFYKDPALRPVTVTVNGADTTRLAHILDRDIGHLVRVKKSGETGARIDRVANIIGKRKVLTADKLLTCTWTLSRGINAGAGLWQAGVVGFSEAGSTTVAA